ncbi:MarR family winged helix-turn-helix transcriptional regulator [Kitasatospora kifunensis]|uniref:DNA-binding MarR family transcriptional regulator n=1 Tax=Kitasatospora kifunensis TaxID=58351 RepID=A0A7W7QYU3_KITKI|nr:MarR family transcriptional regulator [Kitasatospora kifunensis]MBB4922115.1 DNA-binding MarR family transcriptional regulator [Kitasatospora kifunensis]
MPGNEAVPSAEADLDTANADAGDINAAHAQRLLHETAEELALSVGLLVRRLRAEATASGLTLSQEAVLKRLERDGSQTAADLARSEQVRPQSMLATVGALLAEGLIDRTPHPEDGRQLLIDLTEQARVLLRERRAAGRNKLAELLAAKLTCAEQQTLHQAAGLLRRLAED